MDPNQHKRNLVNRYHREHLHQQLLHEPFERVTLSFYRYVYLDNPVTLRDELYQHWASLGCLGRIYLAHEGINAQMSVPKPNWELFKTHLLNQPQFNQIPFKIAVEDDGKSFLKLTVKVRPQIVADGLSPHEYDASNVGTHLGARDWNKAMEQGATVVDIRNHYESEIGHFDGALLPQSENFREELPEVLQMLKGKEEEKILLYCTGGIRCEKTSAYLRHHGFKDVNQLLGGIIDYARQVQSENLPNKFKGKNFVFDNRLGERITGEVISHCHQCGSLCDRHANCGNKMCNLLFIQCQACATLHQGCCSALCIQIKNEPDNQKEQHRWIFASQSGKRFFKNRAEEGIRTPDLLFTKQPL